MSDASRRPIGISKRDWEAARDYNKNIIRRLADHDRHLGALTVAAVLNGAATIALILHDVGVI